MSMTETKTCDMCDCYGQETPATTTREITDLGTIAEWVGTHEHPVCAECAAMIDADARE